MGTVPLDIGNVKYIEERYQAWRRDPDSVGPEWKAFFIGFDQGLEAGAAGAESASRRPPPSAAMPSAASAGAPSTPFMAGPAAGEGQALVSADLVYKQSRVDSLLWAYRDVGYLYARLNPLVSGFSPTHSYLQEQPRETYEQLTLEEFGLSEADLDTVFSAGRAMKPARAPLREIIQAFRETYCGHVGVEFLHIQNKPIRRWLIERMESRRNRPDLPLAKKQIVLKDLIQAEELERFLHSTFIGQKRFSLEGSEAIIPALHFLVDSAHENGIEEIVLGTTHRGRITILNRILNMPPEEIFSFFEGGYPPQMYGGSGDVKYHLGYSTDHVHADGSSVHISLAANPSHLESVDPVVEGKARGAQRRRKDEPQRKRVLPVLLHGDAAFSGQGVVAETFNLSQLEGYTTGGTIHIVINNQIGFTTPARSYRSTFFSTDVAKMLPVPIFHVNGDNPEAVVYVARLALDFRQTFGQDVVIDVFGFRRYGHNEGDEPSFTHPKMYRIIEKHPGVTTLYGLTCEQEGVMGREEQDRIREEFRRGLKAALQTARRSPLEPRIQLHQREDWQGLKDGYSHEPVPTGVPEALLAKIAERITTAPPDFHVHPKLQRILLGKLQTLRKEGTVDWAFAEALSFGSLLLEGTAVRLSGQDAVRGTFAQRHLTWWDTRSPEPRPYTPLNHLDEEQAKIEAFDSPLSEFSVLGFEYGFSLDQPLMLVVWEAQFGDFSNGAQVIIDNFIAAAEAKWHRHSGLVLLLPHGYEGQGPEHSSAHLERFLQLCADDNLQVCNATTPAQYYHLLRRQMRRDFRQPLVVMTPKSLLRHPMAVSPLSALAAGSFQEVLDDAGRPAEPRRLLFCSGKVYYDLVQQRERMRQEGAARGSGGGGRIGANGAAAEPAIVRLEQLHPFPREQLERLLAGYGTVRSFGWVQEEPQNRGAWSFIRGAFESRLGIDRLEYIGRPSSPSPATGSFRRHQKEQEAIVAMALAGSPEERERIRRGRKDAHVA
jgi:2-oxoglutarate dehydrogenase E1 component